jgi:two-component system LytT family sensor kinase
VAAILLSWNVSQNDASNPDEPKLLPRLTPTPDTHSVAGKFRKGNRRGMNWQGRGMSVAIVLKKDHGGSLNSKSGRKIVRGTIFRGIRIFVYFGMEDPMRMTRVTKWGLVTLFWLGWSATCTSFAYSWRLAIDKPIGWLALAPMYFVAYAFWGPLFTPLVSWLAHRFPLERGKWVRSILLHMLAAPCVSLFHAVITTILNPWVWPDMTRPEPFTHAFERSFFMSVSDDIFIYWTVVFVVQGWMYYRRFRDRELRTSILEAQLARAQLQALKVQLHPHFLFNTLNSVSELMHQDVRVAERVITRLSDLLRMTLENIGTQEVTLRDELEFVKGYLEIEQMRFQDRLKVTYDVAPATLDARVPNLLLQPIVENAIRHGISKSSQAGLIWINSEKSGDRVILTVRDNGPGLKSDGYVPTANFGIGLSTTRARLEVLYNHNHTLRLNNLQEGGLEVRIDIPYHSTASSAAANESLTFSDDMRPTFEGVHS